MPERSCYPAGLPTSSFASMLASLLACKPDRLSGSWSTTRKEVVVLTTSIIILSAVALALALAAFELYFAAIAAVHILWRTRGGVLLRRHHSSSRHQGWTRVVIIPSPGMGLRPPVIGVESRLWKTRGGSPDNPSTSVGELLGATELPRAILLFCSPGRM